VFRVQIIGNGLPALFSCEVCYGMLPCDSYCDAPRILFHDKKNSIVISFLLSYHLGHYTVYFSPLMG